ncbi:hypothetical protein F506_02705 [Herbaspirillum hiltneri N3]|uniref:Uncharacterized protein n=1 Tax=Herbaspirillum hiltneri N3 TaxID=1262470 RepID=A0ABM5UX16_9BURK|nr:hypothetical protein [Herbaspirillum hiltneri]AKZ61724.1 hypothetical protein F506_02705 [Herbaspirillum hiltneri N3]
MDFIANLFQQDMFLAVVSYLSVGLVFLLYFFYRERKWENDLAMYQVQNVVPDEAPKMRSAEIYVLNRNTVKQPVADPEFDDEMQVVAGETMEQESMQPEKAVTVR